MKKIIFFLQMVIFLFLMSGLSFAGIENTTTPIFLGSADSSAGLDSPAIKSGNLVFISGQSGGSIKNPNNVEAQIEEAFKKLSMLANAAGGNLDDVVKVNVYLADLSDYSLLNKVMGRYFKKPYPARSTVGASMLPKGHRIEVDAIMVVKK